MQTTRFQVSFWFFDHFKFFWLKIFALNFVNGIQVPGNKNDSDSNGEDNDNLIDSDYDPNCRRSFL